MLPKLKERIGDDRPMVFDGGFSTSLYDKGFYINRSFEEISLTDPQAVKEVSLEFKNAGAEILCTNTFNALLPKLTKYGLQDRIQRIIESSVDLAKQAADGEAYVLGSLGPLGLILEPLGPTSHKEARDYFKTNAKFFEAKGVDGFMLSSFHDLSEIREAILAIKDVSKKPILAHIGIQESMTTSYGHTIPEFIKLMELLDVDVLGFSGEVGPSGMLTALRTARPLTKIPISVLPNAGMPRFVNDQYIYMCNPDYIGKYAKRFVESGANFVGGHNGVGDSHIKAISNALKRMSSCLVSDNENQSSDENTNGSGHGVVDVSVLKPILDEPKTLVPLSERSALGKALSLADKKVISVELLPPRGVDCKGFLKHCGALADAGVKFVNIPDGARAMARMSSLALASYVNSHFDIEAIPHFTCRDRNLIGLQSDILGAHVGGVHNILLVTGDPPKLGNCPGATAVYDVDAIGLTHIMNRMNSGLDIGGTSFGEPTHFSVGVALNPTASNRELEIKRFKYKIEAGADYAITQPIYCLESYQKFLEDLGPVDIPIIMGIWPLVSLRNAEFLRNEVPGVEVPDWMIDEMIKAGSSGEEATLRGVEISVKTMIEARSYVAGYQVSAPFNKVKVALEAIKGANL